MLVECATITSIDRDAVTLKSVRGTACARCARGEGCGGGVISQLVFRRPPELQIELPNAQTYSVGQTVELALDSRVVLGQAARVYLIPLAALLAGGLVGQWSLGSDRGALLMALVALGASVVWLRLRASRHPVTPTLRVLEH
ncbi:MAG: SoxR reducing system RseC family protein [Pseudomonadota bacterium]